MYLFIVRITFWVWPTEIYAELENMKMKLHQDPIPITAFKNFEFENLEFVRRVRRYVTCFANEVNFGSVV